MFRMLGAAVAALVLSCAGSASAATINFDSLAAGTDVGSAYSAQGVVFTNALTTQTNHWAATAPNAIVSVSAGGTFGQADAIIATFSTYVGKVWFSVLGPGQAGIRVEAYDLADVLIGSHQVVSGMTPDAVNDLQTLEVIAPNISYLKIFQVGDGAAIGDYVAIDNFVFNEGVPEPATWAMLIVGFGLVGSAVRRARATALARA